MMVEVFLCNRDIYVLNQTKFSSTRITDRALFCRSLHAFTAPLK
jgi:hypothetical protein